MHIFCEVKQLIGPHYGFIVCNENVVSSSEISADFT